MNKPDNITKILFGIIVVLLGVSLYGDFAVAFWGDQDWELLVSSMWLHGKKLYVDHVPVTGPLLFYLYALPVLLSQHLTFLEDYQALVLFTLFIIAAVITLCTHMMKWHPGFSNASRRLQWIMLLCFLLIVRIQPNFMGDREHLFIILTLPYMLRWIPSLNRAELSLPIRFIIGAIAAVGFCIKPHCMLLFAGIQIVHILYTRSLRILYSPENITIYILSILYCLIIWQYTPEYFTIVLPFAYFTYSANRGLSQQPLLNTLLPVALTFAMLRPASSSIYRKDIYYFSALLPFLGLYIYINNGWLYTYLPFMTLLLLTNGFVLWEFLSQKLVFAHTHWKPLLGVTLCLINFGLEALRECTYAYDVWIHPCHGDAACPGFYKALADEIHTLHAHSFGAITIDFEAWTRASKLTGAEWDTRFPLLWMLPKFMIADNDFYEKHKGILNYVANALADDLDHNKPDIVFVDRFTLIYTMRFKSAVDWVGFLSAASSFKQALGHYKFLHTIDDCSLLSPDIAALNAPPPGTKVTEENCQFDVYRRIP